MHTQNYVYAIDNNSKKIISQSQQFYFPIIKLKIVKFKELDFPLLAILTDKIIFYHLNSLKYYGTFQPNTAYFDGFIDLLQNDNHIFTGITGDGYVVTFNEHFHQLSNQQLFAKDLIQVNKTQGIISYSKEQYSVQKLVLANVQIQKEVNQPYIIQQNILPTSFTKLYQLFYVKSQNIIIINEQQQLYALYGDIINGQIIFKDELEKIFSNIGYCDFNYETQTLYVQYDNKIDSLQFTDDGQQILKTICTYNIQLENIVVKNDVMLLVKHDNFNDIKNVFDVLILK